jgi:hypothetical protein
LWLRIREFSVDCWKYLMDRRGNGV